MKKFLLTILTLCFVALASFADDSQDALNFFNNYVKAANSYSPTIVDMYSPSAKITRQVVKPDGTTQDVHTDTATYIKQMKLGQASAKLKNYKNNYSDVKVSKIADGKYKVSYTVDGKNYETVIPFHKNGAKIRFIKAIPQKNVGVGNTD